MDKTTTFIFFFTYIRVSAIYLAMVVYVVF